VPAAPGFPRNAARGPGLDRVNAASTRSRPGHCHIDPVPDQAPGRTPRAAGLDVIPGTRAPHPGRSP
ncbi:MAG TPA: hypothetical protein VMK84_05860, partial [Streptosporangiaceae bacterium]|nr:hypothetical protein [Streptosporangiaceae bacterium]